ncbi:MAG: electron transfer flavoprotein-ubiquinone oxidoreductase, partial [Rickettsiales bacterium]
RMADSETMEYDVVIVGAGAAGLSAAIRLRQISPDISVCVLEKGSEVGAHILSGCVLEPRALNELLPDWRELGAPLNTLATDDKFIFLTKKYAIRLPTPPTMNNHGNYIISLSDFCRWLAVQAENLGVEIFAGFPAAELLMESTKEGSRVAGVVTGEFGIGKDGQKKDSYQAGVTIKGKYTLFAEGCRGSLSQQLMEKFDLRTDSDPQTYGIGIKELWEVMPEKHKSGSVTHSVGWPMSTDTYGGSFIYHLDNNLVSVGFVVGLDYSNPYLDPFAEFQRFKTHSAISPLFEGGRRISYGARALNEGGFQSIPKLTFAGGAIIGAAAGFMNVPKVKGTHTAMKSAMLAAEAIASALAGGGDAALEKYPKTLTESWVYKELYNVRNIRPAFRFGLFAGLLYAAIDTFLLRGKAPWTLRNHSDHKQLCKAKNCRKIIYPKPDGKITFDKLSSVFLSSTNHEEDQPAHLVLKDNNVPITTNLECYDFPEQRYCPAGVYEIIEENGQPKLQINAQNCVHCKTCDIKDPTQNIIWKTPEGGGGPNYSGM